MLMVYQTKMKTIYPMVILKISQKMLRSMNMKYQRSLLMRLTNQYWVILENLWRHWKIDPNRKHKWQQSLLQMYHLHHFPVQKLEKVPNLQKLLWKHLLPMTLHNPNQSQAEGSECFVLNYFWNLFFSSFVFWNLITSVIQILFYFLLHIFPILFRLWNIFSPVTSNNMKVFLLFIGSAVQSIISTNLDSSNKCESQGSEQVWNRMGIFESIFEVEKRSWI